MVNYSLNFIRLLLDGSASTIAVKRAAEQAYTADLQAALKNTVWRSGCASWYFTKDGWNSTVYPYTQVDFWRRCAFPRWADWDIAYTSKGVARMRRTRVLRVVAVAVAVVGAWRVRRSGVGVKDVRAFLEGMLQGWLARVVKGWTVVKGQLV